MQNEREMRTGKWVLRTWLVIAAAIGVISCAVSTSDAPPQGWWESRGPVVPHETFPADCSLCHTGEGWHELRADFEYDHAAHTGVALEGAHAKAECLRCHNDRGPVASFAGRGCRGCHEDVHQGLAGDGCESCHGQEDWRPTPEIASHARTRFPLIGAHAAAACWRCHPTIELGRFDHVETECIGCHATDLARANAPDHLAQGWTSDCDRCHIPTSWTGSGFNHTGFPLTGQHLAAACTDCHVGGVFAGTPSDCVDCHLPDYNGAQNPNHIALNISTDCKQCHGTSTWLGANFNHVGIVNGCVSCHLPDYNGTANPNHTTAGFPTSCEDCHDTNDWNNANFQHSFPITSGKHRNMACVECHTTPGNFQAFSCIDCHEHNQQSAGSHHSDVQNYVWQSAACYQCHPNGQE